MLCGYLALWALSSVPYVQRRAARFAAESLSQRIGSEVKIGRLELGLLNTVILDSVTLRDQRGRILLSAEKLLAKIKLRSLIVSPITVRTMGIYHADVGMIKDDPNGPYNFQFIIDSLSSGSKKESKPLDFRIKTLILNACNIRHDIGNAPVRTGLDPRHLAFRGVYASLGIRVIRGDSAQLRIRNLEFSERSGLRLSHAYCHAYLSRRALTVPRFVASMPHSRIEAERVSLRRDRRGSISGSAVLRPSQLSLADVRPIIGRDLPNETLVASSSVKIKHGRISLPDIRVSEKSGTMRLRASAWYDNPRSFFANVAELQTDRKFLEKNLRAFLADTAAAGYARRLGDISLRGTLAADASGYGAHADVATALGKIGISGRGADKRNFRAEVSSGEFDVGKLFPSVGNLGRAAFSARTDMAAGAFSAHADIASLEYGGYTYRDIKGDVRRSGAGDVSFTADARDENLNAGVSGMLSAGSDKRQRCEIEANVRRFRPGALHLTQGYGSTAFSGKLSADIGGTSLRSAVGRISVSDLTMEQPDTTRHLGNLSIETRGLENARHIVLSGDFGKAELSGRFDASTLPQQFLAILRADGEGAPRRAADDNIFSFRAHVVDAALLNALAGTNIKLSTRNFASGYFDSREGLFQLDASVPSIKSGDDDFSNLSVYLKGGEQGVAMRFHAEKMLSAGGSVEIESHAVGQGGGIENVIRWNSTAEHKNSGEISQTIRFTQDGSLKSIESQVNPATIMIDDTVWHMSACRLSYSDGALGVRGLRLSHDDGTALSADGVVSGSPADSLMVRLHDIRIGDVLDLVQFDDVIFDGHASGRVNIASVLKEPRVGAEVSVGDFSFNHAAMGRLSLASRWNNETGRIEIDALSRDDEKGSVGIRGYVSPKENYIDLNFDANATNALFLNYFFPDALQLGSGRTSGQLRLYGDLRAMNLEGRQRVGGMRIAVSPLGMTYHADTTTVEFTPDKISFPYVLLRAGDGYAQMTGSVSHRALHDFSYDMSFNTHDFPAYDQNSDGSDQFWGAAKVDGRVHVYGSPGRFTTDASVTPRRGTIFVYNSDQPGTGEDDLEMLRFRNALANGDTATATARATYDGGEKPDISTDIRLNFDINVTPDAELRVIMDDKTGNYISAVGSGNVSAHYFNKGAFNMYGVYTISGGTYRMKLQDLIQKNFTLRSGGRITFDGNPLSAPLSLQAVYTIPSVSLAGISAQGSLRDSSVPADCIMNITGTAAQPQVNFDIDMPSLSPDQNQMVRSLIATPEDMNMQAMYLLSVGRFYAYNYDMAQNSSQSSSQTSLAMNSFLSSTLSSNINSLLERFGGKNSSWQFGTNLATGNDGWNDVDVEGMFAGSLLRGRLQIDGNLGYRDRSAYSSNFVGDFTARYLLNPKGTIQLKAYNESNDRYFTKSTMTTQGGGIVFKRDFNNLREFFGSKRKAKKTKAQKRKFR